MRTRHRNAIELLMSHSDTVVAEMMGIRLTTLRRWMEMPEFAANLRKREREQKAGAARIARQAVINAAATLAIAASNTEKTDGKLLVDIIKASGALEEQAEDPGEALAEVIRRATAREAKRDDQSA